ncbi:MAG TPA: sodium:solute symporter [Paludibacteraceae bacterium]|nr:sodium:solute symporter [Paludibacteraceae bacterium]HQF49930.1 sodium:solute symporter [Paludibacteraceae bacterium]HQJ89827.1 sodium:solute symporter [Paludibacteraceae bacterium]
MLLLVALYVLLLLFVSFLTGRKQSNADYFSGSRKSPWYVVAFGMIGATISGVTFVSVPGWVRSIDFTYIQMCIGFFFGYLVVVYFLLPLYYRLNLTSIYGYLEIRFGIRARQTGAAFFILSKLVSSAAKLYVVVLVLQQFIFEEMKLPFYATTIFVLLVIWLYTYRSGIRTIVWTDFIQTFFLLLALFLLIVEAMTLLDFNVGEAVTAVAQSDYSQMFVFDDWHSRQNFFKQFFSGVFVVVVMTGLDQDIMQKNLSCKNLRLSRKNMLSYGFSFIPVNMLFLTLGVLIILYFNQIGVALPTSGDKLLPFFASQTGTFTIGCFIIGMVASAFSSADSALTSLATSFTLDILRMENGDERTVRAYRKLLHTLFSGLMVLLVIVFHSLEGSSAIDMIYTIVSYMYGPLLGLFSFGLFTKWFIRTSWIPFIAILAPSLTYGLNSLLVYAYGYSMGYEMLIVNGGLMFLGLLLFRKKSLTNLPA